MLGGGVNVGPCAYAQGQGVRNARGPGCMHRGHTRIVFWEFGHVRAFACTHMCFGHALWKRLAISGLQVPGMAFSLGLFELGFVRIRFLTVINQSLISALCNILLSCLGIIVSYSDI